MTPQMKLTKNRLYNEIMQEVDKIQARSHDEKEMLFKLDGLAGKIRKIVTDKYN